jgi:hypothetical protein
MSEAPAGAQLSPDGYYWWDESSSQWQPVSATQSSTAASSAADGSTAAGSSSSGAANSSSAEQPGEGSAEGSFDVVGGSCLYYDLTDAEIDDALMRAGASLDVS